MNFHICFENKFSVSTQSCVFKENPTCLRAHIKNREQKKAACKETQ